MTLEHYNLLMLSNQVRAELVLGAWGHAKEESLRQTGRVKLNEPFEPT